ncbi:MAG TPA: hypothetical protein VM096_12565 [Vicinamibacterales bacterium]|nr:hypothetical protein [Vicinamibacterales bacterium]
MEIRIIPGSLFLQACFYGIALAIVAAAAMLVRAASRSSGDSAKEAARLQMRFLLGALIWIAVISAAAFSGLLLPRGGRPLGFAILVVSIIVLGVTIARSRIGDRLARGASLAMLVIFQSFRFPLELTLHRAYVEGLMPEQMSYSGRNFDIITGVTALLLGVTMMVTRVPRWAVLSWNVLGLILLANIVGVAILSTPAFAYFGPDRLNLWVMWMPYTLLPGVMVLAAWAGHLIVFRALAQPSRSMKAGSSM